MPCTELQGFPALLKNPDWLFNQSMDPLPFDRPNGQRVRWQKCGVQTIIMSMPLLASIIAFVV